MRGVNRTASARRRARRKKELLHFRWMLLHFRWMLIRFRWMLIRSGRRPLKLRWINSESRGRAFSSPCAWQCWRHCRSCWRHYRRCWNCFLLCWWHYHRCWRRFLLCWRHYLLCWRHYHRWRRHCQARRQRLRFVPRYLLPRYLLRFPREESVQNAKMGAAIEQGAGSKLSVSSCYGD